MTFGKRLFDIVATSVGLLVLFPLMIVIALVVSVGDGFPIIFLQERIGRNGVPFRIFKFRTMANSKELARRQLTVGDDPRITVVGRWLRRFKFDELPQLFNVLRGEMSLVGPRPEVPCYVEHYTEAQKAVLDLCPGITDPASVKFRGESAILAQYGDPEIAYLREVMPEKIRLNLEYAQRRTLASDVGIILRTLWLLWR